MHLSSQAVLEVELTCNGYMAFSVGPEPYTPPKFKGYAVQDELDKQLDSKDRHIDILEVFGGSCGITAAARAQGNKL